MFITAVLSDPTMSVCSPQFSPDGKYLVWLQCPVGGPHFSASALIKCNWNTKEVRNYILLKLFNFNLRNVSFL